MEGGMREHEREGREREGGVVEGGRERGGEGGRESVREVRACMSRDTNNMQKASHCDFTLPSILCPTKYMYNFFHILSTLFWRTPCSGATKAFAGEHYSEEQLIFY